MYLFHLCIAQFKKAVLPHVLSFRLGLYIAQHTDGSCGVIDSSQSPCHTAYGLSLNV